MKGTLYRRAPSAVVTLCDAGVFYPLARVATLLDPRSKNDRRTAVCQRFSC
jgi:hypothetical protein